MKTPLTDEQLKDELRRQAAILDRQLNQYQSARPRSRFAYAAHITKTRRRIGHLTDYAIHRGIPLAEVAEILGLTEYLRTEGTLR